MTKKQRWILISVLSGIALAVAISVGGLDVVATKFVNRRLQAALRSNDKYQVTYSSLAVMLVSHTVELRDVTFSIAPDSIQGTEAPLHAHVKYVAIRQYNLIKLLKERQLHVNKIAIHDPEITLNLPMPKLTDTIPANIPLKGIEVGHVKVKGGSVKLSNTGDQMRFAMDDINLSVYDIGYDLQSAALTYNDSTYRLELSNLDLTTPDGLFRIQLNSLETEDAGAVVAKNLHCFHTVSKTSLADKMGKVPATWTDANITSITTSPVNIFRQIHAGQIDINSVRVEGQKVLIFRDVRYPSKKPYPIPQDILLAMKMPLHLQTVQLTLPQLDIELRTQNIGKGLLTVKNANGKLTNITNRRGEKIHAQLHAELSGGGVGDVTMNMKMDKAGHFDFAADCKDVSGSSFNQFMHPLFGMEASIVVNSLTTSYAGDRHRAEGTFCMTYDDIQVHVFKEDTPYQLIAKNAGAINAFAPVVLQRHNPRIIGQRPQSYRVSKNRDKMKDYSDYLMGPLLDGVLKTMLPGYLVKTIDKQTSGTPKTKK